MLARKLTNSRFNQKLLIILTRQQNIVYSHRNMPVHRAELSSFTKSGTLNPDLERRFTERFEIPPGIPVDGMVFDYRSTVYEIFRDRFIVKALQVEGVDPHRDHKLQVPIALQLPRLFDNGSIVLANGQDRDQFEVVLKFPGAVTYYQTNPDHEGLYPALSCAAMLMAIPYSILDKVDRTKPLVVIMQGIPEGDEHIGYSSSSILKLQRNIGQTGIINAEKINVPATMRRSAGGYWEEYERKCKEVIAGSSGVFFILDGYFGKR